MLMPSIFGESLFDSFMDDFRMPMPARKPMGMHTPASAVMKTDIKENENGFELAIDLPGYKKENIKAELKDGYMTVSASNNTENEEKDQNGHYVRRERFYGSCSRSFYVGEDMTQEDIKAKFEDGILKISIPKKEPVEQVPEKKMIAIEG